MYVAYNESMRLFLLIGVFLVGLSPSLLHAEELNAGFVQGLWYASEPVIASEATRVYVALRNNTDHDLTGTVRFTDNGNRIGVSYVSAPLYGEHTIVASLTDVHINAVGEMPGAGDVENTIAEDKIFADYDTDSDGIVNETDTDDDNDTVSDADERTQGTNPLKVNAPTVEEKDAEDTQGTNSDGETSKTATDERKQKDEQSSSTSTKGGLERYIPNPTIRNAVESVTETIRETKTNLDTYRGKRSDALKEYFEYDAATSSETASGTSTTATITRSQVEPKDSFIKSSFNAGKALISGLYSFILFLISGALEHPAILELVLLLFIILFIYRTARRLGRRRTPN
jgi:hypothetical protein